MWGYRKESSICGTHGQEGAGTEMQSEGQWVSANKGPGARMRFHSKGHGITGENLDQRMNTTWLTWCVSVLGLPACWLNATELYSFRSGDQKSNIKVSAGRHSPLRPQGRASPRLSQLLRAPGAPWLVAVSHLCLSSSHLLLGVSVSPLLHLLRTLAIGLRPHLDNPG